MKKAAEGFCVLLKGMLFIGFSIQIILGFVWMCANFIAVQQFGTPRGFLYPLLLGALGKVPQILYLLQLCLAGFAGYVLLKPIFPPGRFWRVWYVLAFLSLPMAIQCHLALLPYSFASSLFLLEFGCCREAMDCESGSGLKAMAGAGICWVGLAMLLPEYLWLGLVPPAVTLLVRLPRLCRSLRLFAYNVLLLAAFGGIAVGVLGLTKTEEGYERTFWFSMASRMTWPTIWQDSAGWSQELLEILPEGTIWQIGYVPENMERDLQPAVEAAVGREKAQEYYREMALLSWQMRKSRIVRQMGWDLLIYAVPEAVLQQQLTGVGYDSWSGVNYGVMAMEHPTLTKYYVNYGCWWFWTAFGITVLFLASLKAGGRRLFQKGYALRLAVYAVSGGAILIYYVMRGSGIADYKCTLAVSVMWAVPALFCIRKERSDEEPSQLG